MNNVDMKAFTQNNLKYVFVVVGFILTLYIQHVNNTREISELKSKCEVLDIQIKETYAKLDEIKLDKNTFETYTKNVDEMKETVKEINKDIKLILSKGKY